MNIATILFTYNRSEHTNKVINALRQSIVLPQKLYIFQDGLKVEKHYKEWKKVKELIKKVNFCPTEIQISEINKGVAKSIVSGISYVLERHDAVIVIEDDCIPTENFISFMEQCFEKYKDNKQIYSVSGYSFPVNLKKDIYDIYACGRISSWGWGTWKDRWKEFKFDNDILKRIKSNENKSRTLAIWGSDCEQMLIENIAGKIDAWDVYWAFHVFENNGICINPYKSLIQNIGFDGSGIHCGINKQFHVEISKDRNSVFILPENLEIFQSTEKAFMSLFGNYTAFNTKNISKENIIIYGLGNFFYRYEQQINEAYCIVAFIDKRKEGWFAGKRIITINDIEQFVYNKIIIMIENIEECTYVAKELINKKIKAEQIVLGYDIYK